MVTKPIVNLDKTWINKSQSWAETAVSSGRMKNGVSCFDADRNTELQALGKMAECVFAFWIGANPDYAVGWGEKPDLGHDIVWCGKKWDVKHTPYGKYLLWSVAKKHLYENKDFDSLVMVRGHPPVFEIVGWVSKEHFRAERETAGAFHKLKPGTWCLHENKLWDIQLFRDIAEATIAARG